jgi:ribosomal protein S18 acetylase RimI-like enzyme
MIRKAEIADLEKIMDLSKLISIFSQYEISSAKKAITKIIENSGVNSNFYVLVEADIVGCGGFSKKEDTTGVYSVNWLVIDPSQQGKGLGTKLYDHIELEIKKLGARLIILNAGTDEKNRFFYKKMGFKPAGEIPKYYSDSKGLVWYYKII